ncbi:hypothetical protein BK669_17320 [Pseudomonas fluorescens]|nr:hypothetical protein BK669_17320 [Pseudomonas fluorescens]
MDLNEYVAALLKQQLIPTPLYIQIPPDLCQILYKTKEESEEAVREMGYYLTWNEDRAKIEVFPEKIVGDHNSVPLESSKAKTWATYIGDFHVHPYKKKYGEKHAIGPSSQDWEGWHNDFPIHKDFSINIVASGHKLFLAIFTQKPINAALIVDPLLLDVQNAAPIIQNFNNDNRQLGNDLAIFTQGGDWDSLRNFYNTHLPQFASTHQQDVSDMNNAIARLNYGCAFYEGQLNHREITSVWLKEANWEAPTALMALTKDKCVACGAVHRWMLSSPFNAWHKCPGCGAVYCPKHGKTLEGKGQWHDRTRKCVRCGERTTLVLTV